MFLIQGAVVKLSFAEFVTEGPSTPFFPVQRLCSVSWSCDLNPYFPAQFTSLVPDEASSPCKNVALYI
jgi:hypothetical protein